jgi:hypothetical protein
MSWQLRVLACPHRSRSSRRLARAGSGLASAMLLSGCTWFAPDAGMGVVATIAQRELNKDAAAIRSPEEAEAAGATVRRLLGRTLTADVAVQIALLNNRGLQAAYDELAIADAERVGQSLPPNPTYSWRRIQAGPALESEMQLVTAIIALAILPARSDIAAERFYQAQLRAADETLAARLACMSRDHQHSVLHCIVALAALRFDRRDHLAISACRLGRRHTRNFVARQRFRVSSCPATARWRLRI